MGYTLPFEFFAATWITDAEKLADRLNARNIAGVTFRPAHIRPYYGSGKGKTLHGVQVHITNLRIAPLTLLVYYFMEEVKDMYGKDLFALAAADRISMFDKVSGSSRMRKAFQGGGLEAVVPIWLEDVSSFRNTREPYLLY